MTYVCIVIAVVAFVLGFGAAVIFETDKPSGTLHIDKTGEKDNYLFEINDLNSIESKQAIRLTIDLKS